MKYHQMSIYDAKAKAYLPPFVIPEIEMAIRVFSDCIDSGTHQFSKHPEDYTLFTLGTWDDSTGLFTRAENGAHPIGNGVEFIRPHSPDLTNGQTDPSLIPLSNEPPILESTPSDDPEI